MTRLLLVGCGKIAAAAHLPALRDLQGEGAVKVLVSDVNAERAVAAAQRFGLEPVPDWREALASVDALSACLPPGQNAQVSAEAVEAGLHVICEKPPGRDGSQATAMARVAAAHPEQVTMVAFNRRFNPLYRQALAMSAQLGPPTSFYGRVSGALLGKPPSDAVDDWLSSAGSHALDLAIATMGFPTSVSVDRRRIGAGPDNAWSLQLHCAGGSALLLYHFAAGRRTEHYEWLGPTYDVRLDLPTAGDFAVAGQLQPLTQAGEFHEVSGFTDEYRAFLAAVAGGDRPACDFGYGARFMALVDAVLSARSGTLTPVPIEGEGGDSAPAGRHGPPYASSLAAAIHSTQPPSDRSADTHEREQVTTMGPSTIGPSKIGTSRPIVVLHQPVAAHGRFFSAERLSALHQRSHVRVMGGDDPAEILGSASVIVTGRGAQALSSHLEDAPHLGLVVVVGASVRSLDPERLVERGVVVCNTADSVARSVAEHCLMVTLAGLRRLTAIDRQMHGGGWPRPGRRAQSWPRRLNPRRLARRMPLPPPVRTRLRDIEGRLRRYRPGASGHSQGPAKLSPYTDTVGSDLRGQVVGLIGWGHTAHQFSCLLAPFGCQVLVASQSADQSELDGSGARRASIGEILGSARVVSLHRGLTDATRGFLDASMLERLSPGTLLVNTARGELIDENALVARLARGDIGAALDVFVEEPLPRRHPLRRMPNVILTPHNASTTEQEEQRMGDEALTKVIDWLEGRPVQGLTLDRLSRMT